MICTEEEARKKWCPHKANEAACFFVSGNEESLTENPDCCIASDCMMWEWEGMEEWALRNVQKKWKPGDTTLPRLGYCGLGGKP